MPTDKTDWNEVANLKPRGLVIFKDSLDVLFEGPFKQIEINPETNEVGITLDWVIYFKPNSGPDDKWRYYSKSPVIILKFANGLQYEIESTSEKGRVIHFGKSKTIYIDHLENIDMSKIEGYAT